MICDRIWENVHTVVHTSNFSTSMTHKIYLKWWIDVKHSGIVVLLFLYHPWKFHISIPFPVVFMILQMSKIGCVNYAHFPKSGHILLITQSHLSIAQASSSFKCYDMHTMPFVIAYHSHFITEAKSTYILYSCWSSLPCY